MYGVKRAGDRGWSPRRTTYLSRKERKEDHVDSQDGRKPGEADVTDLERGKYFKKKGVFINLCIVYGYFCVIMVVLSCCNRDHTAHKAKLFTI